MKHAIAINNLNFGYQQTQVFEDLNLDIRQGQLTCLLGQNGAGKTTLINIILDRIQPQSGTINYFGDGGCFGSVKHRFGTMLQNASAPEKAKVKELIKLVSSYYPSPVAFEELVKELSLDGILDKQFGQLSGGQKQLALFAIAVCGDPEVIFLDEPTVGMDIDVRRQMWEVIQSYKIKGKTIVLTTHYLEEADSLADRILLLQDGLVIADGTPDYIKSHIQGKTIVARTTKNIEWLEQLPGVISVRFVAGYAEVQTQISEETMKIWLAKDESLSELTIVSADLEQAVLKLTA